MLLRRITSLLPLLVIAHAFKNTSPFLMISSQPLLIDIGSLEIERAREIDAAIQDHYARTTSNGRHVILSVPGLRKSDMQHLHKLSAFVNSPSSTLDTRLVVPDVIGELDVDSIRYYIKHAITNEDDIIVERKAELSEEKEQRIQDLTIIDVLLGEEIEKFTSKTPTTIMLVSTPGGREPSRYEMDDPYSGLVHQDLKRDTDLHGRASNGSSSNRTKDNFQDGLPLFERYAYFSPPLFMGLAVSILLISILWVGVSAIAGLEVSYMAFSKEMSQQKPQKQQ